MIAAISKQVSKDKVRLPNLLASDVTFNLDRDLSCEDDEYNNDDDVDDDDEYDADDNDVDTGGFEASGIGKPAQPSSFQPDEGPKSSFGGFSLMIMMTMGMTMTMVMMTMMMTMGSQWSWQASSTLFFPTR